MRTLKRRQRHSLPFCLFLAVVGALLLPAALAPRANAGSTDYSDFEPQGVLINQPLASNYNPTLASNVAPGDQPSGFQPLAPLANFLRGMAASRTVMLSTGTRGGRQPAPGSPPSTAISPERIIPKSPQLRLSANRTGHGESEHHDLRQGH